MLSSARRDMEQSLFGFLISGFEFLSDFGLRASDFR